MKLYKGYVTKSNEIRAALTGDKAERSLSNAVYSKYRGLKKGETFAMNGVILHEYYFQNMTKETTPMGCKTEKMLKDAFGSCDNWRDDIIACAKSTRGWAILSYEQRSCTFRNILLDAHDDGSIVMAVPILVLDMYEHSYFLDYGTDKDAYIKQFLNAVNWKIVERRLNSLMLP